MVAVRANRANRVRHAAKSPASAGRRFGSRLIARRPVSRSARASSVLPTGSTDSEKEPSARAATSGGRAAGNAASGTSLYAVAAAWNV